MRNADHLPRRAVACLLGLALCCPLPGCGPTEPTEDRDAGIDPDIPVESFSFDIGLLDEGGAGLIALGPDDVVDIVVGFQGLIFIDLALEAPGEPPDELVADATVHFADAPDLDYSFRDNQVRFRAVAGGKQLCPAFRVPFGQDLTLIDGQPITVSIVLTARGWRGQGDASFQIADVDPCIEGPEGELVCE